MSGVFVMFHLIFETELFSEPGTLHLQLTDWRGVSDPFVSRYLGYRWTSLHSDELAAIKLQPLFTQQPLHPLSLLPHPSVDSLNLLCCYSLSLDLTMTI